MALLFPILLAIVIGIVQTALWAHATSVAQAAADYGAEIAAAYDSDAPAGEQAALTFLSQASAVRNGSASAAIDTATDQVTVTVNAQYPSVFGLLGIEATATTVRERLPAP